MYLTGKLEIDPSQITIYKKVKPSKLFSKLLDVLSFGAFTEKQEHETFTAVSILQQLNIGLRSINVKNVIRLAIDDYDFYLDERGEEDDLEQAMFEFKAKVDPIESELFNTIYLVLEHLDDEIKYLIEIAINRKHKIGEYPIKINVNGVMPEFKQKLDEPEDELRQRICWVFASQETYDDYMNKKITIFGAFIDELEGAIKRYIKVDDIRKEAIVQIIRPSKRILKKDEIKHERYANPVYYGYYGFDDYFLYTWMWSGAMWHHNIYCSDFTLVDSIGREILKVGGFGFNGQETNSLNDDASFEPPISGDVSYFTDNDYEKVLLDAGLIEAEEVGEPEYEETDWLDAEGSEPENK